MKLRHRVMFILFFSDKIKLKFPFDDHQMSLFFVVALCYIEALKP